MNESTILGRDGREFATSMHDPGAPNLTLLLPSNYLICMWPIETRERERRAAFREYFISHSRNGTERTENQAATHLYLCEFSLPF